MQRVQYHGRTVTVAVSQDQNKNPILIISGFRSGVETHDILRDVCSALSSADVSKTQPSSSRRPLDKCDKFDFGRK